MRPTDVIKVAWIDDIVDFRSLISSKFKSELLLILQFSKKKVNRVNIYLKKILN